ncbi:class I SAM-dependent methyltransferase [Singulisphaera sp. PoT]|uniref:class I SAM-dependent methyltransferase n=1 Tax=Singulisphaera sp. PoT TaxID=3411797 RepID=UPI003BF4C5C4
MDPKHLEELIAVERGYWWHVAKRELVLELLRRYFPPSARLVEGGVGGGANLLAYRELGYDVSGFDLMPEAVAHCKHLGIDDVQTHDLEQPWPVKNGPARVVVLLDVIEHVADPVKVLKNASDILDEKGGILVTVPAIPALLGPWDRMLGHYRRYSRKLLREHAGAAGLRVTWLSSWNAFTLPPAIVVRTLERMGRARGSAEFPKVSPAVNHTLINLARIERGLIRTTGLPVGLSLVGVLKR